MSLPKFGPVRREIPVLDASTAANPWVPGGVVQAVEQKLPPRQPTNAERARTIVSNNRLAVLSLVMTETVVPVGFVIPYSVDEAGVPYFGVRSGMVTTMQLRQRMPVSVTVAESPLTASHAGFNGGVTILGKLDQVSRNDRHFDDIVQFYGRMQPVEAAAVKRGASDLFRITVAVILMTAPTNDGEALRIEADEYGDASSDALAAVAPSLVSHLDNDHGGSLVLLCRAFGGQPDASSARLAGIDQHGMDLLVVTPKGRESVRLNFGHPVSTAEEVRRELATMARGARFKLGVG